MRIEMIRSVLLAAVVAGCGVGTEGVPATGVAEPTASSEAAVLAAGCPVIEQLGETEVIKTGTFVGAWMKGSVPKTPANFRFNTVLAPSFWLHTPDGSMDAAATKSFFYDQMYGAVPTLTAVVDDNFRTVACAGGVVVLEFDERYLAGTTVLFGFKVTSVLKLDPSAPGKMKWVQLHETALPAPTP
jgi:hypothetical protein